MQEFEEYVKAIEEPLKHNFYRKYIKRILDILFAAIALIVLSPVFGVTAVLVSIKLGKPVIFKQKRPGLHEKIFTVYKFRTMTDEKDADGNLLPDSIRLTKFGKLLRSTSIDELPELWNIVKGDMSFVGPRPLLIQYLPLYNEHQRKRHFVRPGLSGLAQISGRNGLSWEDKFDMDVKYVKTLCLVKDFKIVLSTIRKVLLREGISSRTSSTMETFKGTRINQ
ncbi:MAG: sugar transferase [Bacteroidetes bacterium]|nr:sugar transferase [Bacteroidota bacterium]